MSHSTLRLFVVFCIVIVLRSLALHLMAGPLCLSLRSASGCQPATSSETQGGGSVCSLFCCTELPGALEVPILPVAVGIVTRFTMIQRRGKEWYDTVLMPRLGPTALVGLLFTIVVMFSMQGDKILAAPLDVLRVAIPLVAYFLLMFAVSFALSMWRKFPYELAATQSFTSASNNFELAIAVAVGTFGIASQEALATVIGPLIEVPVLIGLVYVALWVRRSFYGTDSRLRQEGRA